MNIDTRPQIETALRAFSGSDLRTASIGLLNSLGYQSEKTLDLDNTPDTFLAEFDKRDREFRKDKALFDYWKSVEFLFQITDDEVRNAGVQGTLFDSGYDHGNYQSYLFFALDLKKNHYTRTQLADITREINLLFDMPAMLLIRHNGALTFSVIDRRLHKKDQRRDVLKKVKLIKDIRYQDPHRAHIEILHDLSLQALMSKHECRDFKQLHEAWRTALDTNELNKKFYRELADWYFWALDHVEFPDDVEKNTPTRNATNVIRLLTRLIFCWFLKEKGLIPANLFSERKLATVLKSLKEEDSSFYWSILQNLFFGTLNQRMNTGGQENRRFANDGSFLERKDEYGIKNLYRYQKLFAIAEEEAVKLFSDIPFMNGGLFDCFDKEDDSGKVIYVDGFTRNARKQPKVPNFLFFSDYRTLDLSKATGDKKKKKEKVRGLINLLDSYKFTVTENTPIEEEIALDPELLGKVFENLLASYNPETGTTARKQTGSFYTPREIVQYMVDESLIAYLEGQLKAKVPKLAEMKDLQDLLREVFAYTEKVHPFDEDEVEALIDAIDTCKILDPACGSGAFPMGILHKLVFILGKLDPNNERWKRKQLDKLDSVSMREELERIFEDNDDDYGRKLYLIENCIYGVDIQPIAIQISKLRFFISLICDQRTNKNKAQNCGVRPLPNLETKFVAANTLISLDRGKGQQLPMTDPRLPKLESELAAVRHRHFAVQRRRNKLALQKRDAELREEIASVLAGGGMSGKASHRLAAWDPYDQNTFAKFFDSEWMFGLLSGFDIVIGNPPYGLVNKRQNKAESIVVTPEELDYFKTAPMYEPALGGMINIFRLFIIRSIHLLSQEGVFSEIFPLAFTADASMAKLRKHVLANHSVLFIEAFPERDNVAKRIFEATKMSVCIMHLTREKTRHSRFYIRISGDRFVNLNAEKAWLSRDSVLLLDREGASIPLVRQQELELLKKIYKQSVRVGDLGHCFTGEVDLTIGKRFITNDSSNPPLLRGAGITKYGILTRMSQGEFLYIKENAFLNKASANKQKHTKMERIVLQGITGVNEQTRLRMTLVSPCTYLANSVNYLIFNTDVNQKAVLGVLNSNVTNFVFSRFSTNSNVNGYEVDNLPLPKSVNECIDIADLVDEMLSLRKMDEACDLSELESKINKIVYRTYGLTDEEIAILEDRDT